jgi:hypothetical protein
MLYLWDLLVNLINRCSAETVTQNTTFIVDTNVAPKIKEDFFCKWAAKVAHALQIDCWWEWVGATSDTRFLWLNPAVSTFDKSLSYPYYNDSYFVSPISNRIKIIIVPINTVVDALNSWEFALQEDILVTSVSDNSLNCLNFRTDARNNIICWSVRYDHIASIINDEIVNHEFKFFW